jgi:hypothetical protein
MRKGDAVRIGKTVPLFCLFVALLVSCASALEAAACINGGTDSEINGAFASKLQGAEAVLCPGAVFRLSRPIVFTAKQQKLYTQGRPSDDTRALLVVSDPMLSTAIYADHWSGVQVDSVRVDGNRSTLGPLVITDDERKALFPRAEALLCMGGGLNEVPGRKGSNQKVLNTKAWGTRSWTLLTFNEGYVPKGGTTPTCQGGEIRKNTFGPAGTPDSIADGISLACGSTIVDDNDITDATDGGIVIFGAPGYKDVNSNEFKTKITNNRIYAVSQQLLGGINLVDFGPVSGNYTLVEVSNNRIIAQSAFIKVGIAMGPSVWSPATSTIYGASVTSNSLEGDHFGYGYAVNGVRGFTVTGNTSGARHVGVAMWACRDWPRPSQPGAFQYQESGIDSTTILQSQFQKGNLGCLLDVYEPGPGSYGKAYQGCYADLAEPKRALPNLLIANGATKESCIAKAREKNYLYAGLQWYGACFGGNNLGYNRDCESTCNTPCTAAPGQMCGGAYHNSVWSTGVSYTPGPPPINCTKPEYLGCFTDDQRRALSDPLIASGATVETCTAKAKEKHYLFAGLQWYGSCFGGNDLGIARGYKRVCESECNKPCSANSSQTCGGAYRNSVWSTGIPVTPAPPPAPECKPEYQGCYTDSEPRALPILLTAANATVDTCIKLAYDSGYRYAGLQWYGYCFAGNTLAKQLAPESQCNTVCTAKPSEMCGGAWRNSIWSTGRDSSVLVPR